MRLHRLHQHRLHQHRLHNMLSRKSFAQLRCLYCFQLCFLLCILSSVLSACSNFSSIKPQSPSITVADVRPLSLSLNTQTIGLSLRVANPNNFDLPMQSLTFLAHFSGQQFAKGHSVNNVIVPANGEALLDVEVEAGLVKLANQLKSMLDTENAELNYDVSGVVKLANWPKAIPFNVEGEIEDPRVPAE